MTWAAICNSRNILLFSSIIFLLLPLSFQIPLVSMNFVSGTVDNKSKDIIPNDLDSQSNVITSQNTGNSKDNVNPGSQISEVQDESKSLTLHSNEDSDDIASSNDEQTNISTSPSQPSKLVSREVNPACGQLVQGDVKLSSNLICKGDGIIVNGNNTTIDMNGYSLKGPGMNSNKVGIMVGGQNNVTVSGNGIISGFQSGIYVSGSSKVYTHEVNVNNNKVAFYFTGTQYPQISNNMANNNTIGVALHSSKNAEVTYNQMSQNRLSGVTLINTGNSVIHGNNILNTSNGIFLDTQSSSNKIDFNNVFNNILDINNANNLPTNINDNQYSNNNCQTSLPSGLCIGR